jgi:Bax protein
MFKYPSFKKAGSVKALLFLLLRNSQVQVFLGLVSFLLIVSSIWFVMDLGRLVQDETVFPGPQNSIAKFVPQSGASIARKGGSGFSKNDKQIRQRQIEPVTRKIPVRKINIQKQTLYNSNDLHNLTIQRFPSNLDYLDVNNKKQTFFQLLLPSIVVALKEVQNERQRLLELVQKISFQPTMTLSLKNATWQSSLSSDEILFLVTLSKKYRSHEAADLIRKVNIFPVSLILAQGAIESSWGTSRFAVEGNNIFGVWTWGEKGIIPYEREEGKTHKVAVYDSILDSVRDYILTLNRHYAYEDLRMYRMQTKDSLVLAEGLKAYSQRREEYVTDVKRVIESNNLQYYDTIQLTASHNKKTYREPKSDHIADAVNETAAAPPSS